MTMEHGLYYQADPGYVCREVAGEYLLLSVDPSHDSKRRSQLVSINETAYFLWTQLQVPLTLEELCERAKKEFRGTEELLEREVKEFVHLLIEQGFLQYI